MARTLPALGTQLVIRIEDEWEKPQPDWARKRLLVVRLIAQHKHGVAQIAEIAGVSRQTVFTYRDAVVAEGVEGGRVWLDLARGTYLQDLCERW